MSTEQKEDTVELDLLKIQVLELQPKDILVVNCPQVLSRDAMNSIRERFRELFKTAGLRPPPITVLQGGVTLSVIREEATDE